MFVEELTTISNKSVYDLSEHINVTIIVSIEKYFLDKEKKQSIILTIILTWWVVFFMNKVDK